MQERHTSFRRAARQMQLQPLCGPFQFTRSGVEADQAVGPPLVKQTKQQFALATPQISDGLSAGCTKRLNYRHHPFVVQPDRRLQRIFRCATRLWFDRFFLRLRRQPLESGTSQNATMTKITADDQFLRRVLIEPALAAPE